ncbi:A.superbus venom factor 1-like [Corticium candelabrum]|uniref:A.superbus venom factor 1-like n=1 Tax=Corticium candelabrum TaxID=121492 RepID=UPI002E272F52|nr:A.superbus venom factor 1-like [Corticium candelabrum]
MKTFFGDYEVEMDIRVEPEGVLRYYDYRAELDPEGENMADRGGCNLAPPLDARDGECFKSFSRSDTCENPIAGRYTMDQCCSEQIGSFSVAFSDGITCVLCPSRTELHLCGVDCSCAGSRQTRKQVNYFYVRAPEEYIEGSQTAWLGVTGEYFAINEDIDGRVDAREGINSLVRLPSGCGEQNMVKFAPTCAVISFLHATSAAIDEEHRETLRKGYVHQMQYRSSDGGFAGSGGSSVGKTLLSSYVLATLCRSRQFIYVDPSIISGVFALLESRRLPSGQFKAPKKSYNTRLLGQDDIVYRTAYVAMSLLECCLPSERGALRSSVCPAVTYIQNEFDAGRVRTIYAKSIIYFALMKACNNNSSCSVCNDQGVCDSRIIDNVRRDLFREVIINDDGSRYWDEKDFGRSAKESYYKQPNSYAVEMTSFILQACLIGKDCRCAASAAKWLNSVRNSYGGFVSTHDTVIGLYALSAFTAGCSITVLHPPNLCVKVRQMSNPEVEFANFRINQSNAALTQRIQLPINNVYQVETCGTGLGQSMVHVEYNVPSTGYEKCAFAITANGRTNASSIGEGNDADAEIAVCVRYLGDSCTGMANIEVELPTGYAACNESSTGEADPLCLSDILSSTGKDLKLDFYEINSKSVVFYFDELCSAKNICITFKAYRKFEVMRSLPVSVKAYDYYRPAIKCTEFYTLDGGSSKLSLICDDQGNSDSPTCVCGAGRCPVLETIENRTCNACVYHEYVYRVRVLAIEENNGWSQIKVHVVDILKPGRVDLNASIPYITLWLPEVCQLTVRFQIGEDYHVQGLDGLKFVLDHNSHIERWPERTLDECKEKERNACFRKACKKSKNSKQRKECEKKKSNKNKCREEVKTKCKDVKKFYNYVSSLKDGNKCELVDICK